MSQFVLPRQVATVAALRSVARHRDKAHAFVLGTKDVYLYDAAETTADDGLDFVKPDDVGGGDPGRWVRYVRGQAVNAGRSALIAWAQSIPHNFSTHFDLSSAFVYWDDDSIFDPAVAGGKGGFVIPASWVGKNARVTFWLTWDNTDSTGVRYAEAMRGAADGVDFPGTTYKPLQTFSSDAHVVPSIETNLLLGEILTGEAYQTGAGNINVSGRILIERMN